MHLERLWKYEIRCSVYLSIQERFKNLDKLFSVINTLANGETLNAKYKDHDLMGNYKGTRECHIEPDWLLVYEIKDDVLVLMLYRLGTHSELF